MDRSKSTRFLAIVLCLVMIIGVMPVFSFAADDFSLTIASTKTSALAPGVQEQEIVAYDANGDRVVYYAVTADVATNPDVQVKANYHDNDNTGVWGKATVIEQANAATEKRGYNVVAIANAAYYNVSTGQPTGGFVMEGVNINGDAMGNQYPFFAILKDGTAMIGQKGTFSQYSANIQEAVGGWNMLVWDGKIVNNGTSKYPRSTVGVKANGDVVMMVADGNQKPYSAGLTYREQAEVMLSLGCVAAVELDGGGSATYAAKLEGTDELVVRNSCCDGTVRSVSNTLMVISTAVADGTFDHANLATDYVFYAPYSKVEIDATGADKSGHPADLPAGATWALSDDSFGTIADGVFTSTGKLGTVTASMLVDGKTVGSVDITLVNPTEIAFGAEEKMIPYGKPSDFTVTALYNGADMYAAADAYDFVCTAGTMNGFLYTAPAEGAGTTATVTATYKYDSSVASDSVAVTFGKGSDVLFDFEDGIDQWGTYFDMVDAAEKGEYTGGYTNAYESEGSSAGNMVELGIHEDVFLATKENGGKVHSGENALGYTLDYRYSSAHANWQYAYLYFWGEPITLLDTEGGVNGTRLGMWMYIPEEAVGSCARFCYTYERADGVLNTAYLYLTYQYVEKGFSKLTSDKIPEAGWAYVYVDMKQISDTYVSTSYYKDENGFSTRKDNKGNGFGEDYTSNYAPGFIQFIISSSAVGAEKVTFYIDDITLDYSDAVDDRDMPIISDPLVLDSLNSYPINGGTIAFNEISVTASAVEDTTRGSNYTGLDESTAQVYVDGRKVPTQFAAGKISASGLVLADGIHDITFEIADKQGNYTKLTRQVNVQAGTDYPSLTLSGKPTAVDKNGNIYSGGQYDITLSTDKVEAIDNVEFQLWLNSASEWALKEMTVLPGFEATYELDELACMATIKIQRVNSEATGEASLVTIPVYAWSWNEELGQHSASYQWNTEGCAPQTTVSYKVKYGFVTYTDAFKVTNSKYFAGFSNVRVDAKTELNSSIANLKNTIGEWHYHTAVAVDDVDATCTTGGHTGRTKCSVCNSILTWGTTEATGHSFELKDGIYGCACGELFNGEKDGATYIDGVAYVNGWYNDTYYFVDGKKVTGPYVIDKKAYVFGEDGVYQPDGLFTGFIETAEGTMYFFTNTDYTEDFVYISGEPYFFEDGYLRNGEYIINGETCLFEGGKFVSCSTADLYLAGWAGPECQFIHYKDGRFLFLGKGGMFYHQSNSTVPWANNKHAITSVFIAKDITEICRFAFAHAYYITDIEIEEGSVLEAIRYSAFHYVNKIKSFKLPDTVKVLEWRAFGYWTSLEKIYLPDGIESIHKDAFDHHKASLVLQVAEGTYGETYANQYGFVTELREKIPVVLHSGTCGEGLTWNLYDTGVLEIAGTGSMPNYYYAKYNPNAAPWALYRNDIKKVVIGDGVANIGEFAFYECKAMTEIVFEGESLTKIAKGAFGYTGLTSVTLPASLETIADNAFYYSASLETVAVAEGSKLSSVGAYAFRNCTALKSVYLPDGVIKIGTQIYYAAGSQVVTNVAEDSYAHRYAVQNGYAVELREAMPSVLYSGTTGDLTWELYDNGMLVISGNGAMPNYHYAKNNPDAAPWAMYRSMITKVVIGSGVTSIGEFAFYQCTAMTQVQFSADGALTEIAKGAFGYTGLTAVTLPASLVTIGDNAFYYSAALETVDVAEGSELKNVGSYAFRNCTALKSVYLPDGVSKIGSVIYYACGNQVVTSVAGGSYAHSYAAKNGYAVDLREALPVVLCTGTCGDGLTWNLYDNGVLEITGKGAMSDYHYAKYNPNAAPWALYRGDIKKVVIGSGVTYIGAYAFYECKAMTEVVFQGSTLNEIGKAAFGYSGLVSVTVPASVKIIGDYAFYYSALQSLSVESGSQLVSIGSYAFRNCTSLKRVELPASIKSIGSVIFYACGDQVVVVAPKGSYAAQYAAKNGCAVEEQ